MENSSTMPHEYGLRKKSYLLIAVGIILIAAALFVGTVDNVPGILSMLVGSFAVILGVVFRAGKSSIRTPAQQLLYWAPRVLCIVTALFISIFALDVFNEAKGFWGTTVALLMHLIPTFLILIVLAVSWRREWIGGVLFIGLAALYAVSFWNASFASSAIPLISGPLVLTGALFLLNWYYRVELRRTS